MKRAMGGIWTGGREYQVLYKAIRVGVKPGDDLPVSGRCKKQIGAKSATWCRLVVRGSH
jgi:hypothetical protein